MPPKKQKQPTIECAAHGPYMIDNYILEIQETFSLGISASVQNSYQVAGI